MKDEDARPPMWKVRYAFPGSFKTYRLIRAIDAQSARSIVENEYAKRGEWIVISSARKS
jgi:hypothetical protein